MRRKWMLLIICYVVPSVLSLPVNTTQPSQGSEFSLANSINSEDQSKLSSVPVDLDNSAKANKAENVNVSNEIVNKPVIEGDQIEQDNNSKATSSDGSKAASDQPDDEKNADSKNTSQVSNAGAATPETPSANNNAASGKEQGIGDNSDDETVSEGGNNPLADKTDGNDTNADGQTTGESGKSPVADSKDNSNPANGNTIKETGGSTVKETEGSIVKETDGSKGNSTIDKIVKSQSSEAPRTDGDVNNKNNDSSSKDQGVSDNASTSAASGINDKMSSESPSDDKKSSFTPAQGNGQDVAGSVDQDYVDISQQTTQKQNVNNAEDDDFATYYQDSSKYDSKSSMDGSIPQVGPSYDDTDGEEPVPVEDRKQYEDETQTFISGGGQNQKMGGQFTDDEDSHFFAYFLTIMVTAIIFYLVFHNKQRIIALIIEGRAPRNGRSRRSSGRAKYHKLDNNLEEAITATKGSKYDGLY